jgi:hypothetical protein
MQVQLRGMGEAHRGYLPSPKFAIETGETWLN